MNQKLFRVLVAFEDIIGPNKTVLVGNNDEFAINLPDRQISNSAEDLSNPDIVVYFGDGPVGESHKYADGAKIVVIVDQTNLSFRRGPKAKAHQAAAHMKQTLLTRSDPKIIVYSDLNVESLHQFSDYEDINDSAADIHTDIATGTQVSAPKAPSNDPVLSTKESPGNVEQVRNPTENTPTKVEATVDVVVEKTQDPKAIP